MWWLVRCVVWGASLGRWLVRCVVWVDIAVASVVYGVWSLARKSHATGVGVLSRLF